MVDHLQLLPMVNGAAMEAASSWMRSKNLRAKSAADAVAFARVLHDTVAAAVPGWLLVSDEMGAAGLVEAAGCYVTGMAVAVGIEEAKAALGAGLLMEVPETEQFKARQAGFASVVEEIARGLGIPGVLVESRSFSSKEEMEAYFSSLAKDATAFAGSKDAPRAAPPPVENGEAVQAGP